MKSVLLEVLDEKKALKELLDLGIKESYQIKDKELKKTYVGGFFDTAPQILRYSLIKKIDEAVDWQEQSRLFSPYFKDGNLEIPLVDFGFKTENKVFLKPGEGFGDLSHPTTSLVLKAMAKHATSHDILDIGSGSGILTLAAIKGLGCEALGIERDVKALELSKENAVLNDLNPCLFSDRLDASFLSKSPLAVVINMIASEQEYFFSSQSDFCFKGIMIVSGLLEQDVENYLKKLPLRNISLVDQFLEKEWVCLILKLK